MKRKLNDVKNGRLNLAIFLIILQVAGIIYNLATKSNKWPENVPQWIGYLIFGIVGIILLILDIADRIDKKNEKN